MNNKTDSNQTQLAAACILLSVADADEILENKELEIISDILQEFFTIDKINAGKIFTFDRIYWYADQINVNDIINFIIYKFPILQILYLLLSSPPSPESDLHPIRFIAIASVS